jgi:ATP-dependent Lhr-like helicase
LAAERRAGRLQRAGSFWVAAERLPIVRTVYPGGSVEPGIVPPASEAQRSWDRAEALRELLRGRLEVVGPTTAATLAEFFRLPLPEIDAGLLALEAEGFILRGRFRPGAADLEWCERRLLARIHRLTINRLRAEIQPVSLAEFQRFLRQWQRVGAEDHAEGPAGVEAVLELLDGYELPAAAWEPAVLAARVKDYTPQWLDHLCLTGRIGWGRLSPPQNQKPGFTPLRSSPTALFARAHLPHWLELSGIPAAEGFSADTKLVFQTLLENGALFFSEIVRRTGLLQSRTEQALGELAAQGWVTADSFEGMRALLVPGDKRAPFGDVERRRHHRVVTSVEFAGRWSLLRTRMTNAECRMGERTVRGQPAHSSFVIRHSEPSTALRDEALETFARALLRRYGIIFRRLLEREALRASWFDLGRVYRRWEARGEIRGGYFVSGVSGEQFALPEAIGLLRSLRKSKPRGELTALSAADPLNLIGVLTPGPRIPALWANRILLRDGVPIAALDGGRVVKLEGADETNEREIDQSLKVGTLPTALRRYYR